MEARAFWDQIPTPTSSLPPSSSCTPLTLPRYGTIDFNNGTGEHRRLTLTANAQFYPTCTGTLAPDVTVVPENAPPVDGIGRDPFYASSLPVIYALAATTVTAYMLVILLFITPRTFISGGTVVLGRRGFTSGTSGSEAGVGIGGRPLLQKVAALSVAISLSIATANTFHIAETQYNAGYMDAEDLQKQVLGSLELKVIMVISDTFLWLAQAQTLIRLFPRHREKIIIKWTALALITLCVLFSILNDFVYAGYTRPAAFVDAIPALSYLFQIALSLLYSAWVIYYALTKKRYAFYHPKMRNMCLVALISVLSILVPVVFFVVDISMPDVAGWGDYVRWVGAAAASAVVWEWVERIEALERNEKKDGVLGREIFDGDEMLEVTPSTVVAADSGGDRDGSGGGGGGAKASGAGDRWPDVAGAATRYRVLARPDRLRRNSDTTIPRPADAPNPSQWPTRPAPAATPGPRTDTASAESTVYAIRYHPIGETRSSVPEQRASFDIEAQRDATANEETKSLSASSKSQSSKDPVPIPAATATSRLWAALDLYNPFSRSRQRPPPEVSAAHTTVCRLPSQPRPTPTDAPRWDLLGKLEDFASEKAEQRRARRNNVSETAALPVMRIPAPPPRMTREMRSQIARDAMGEADAEAGAREQEANVSIPAATWPLSSPATVEPSLGREEALVQRVWEVQERNSVGRSPEGGSGPRTTTAFGEERSVAGGGRERGGSGSGGTGYLPVLRIPAPPLRGSSA